ncbi:MAG: GyrI-like domain-containing protein [Chthonomonadales bacterium]|nr:GyrI-like domain-containing protein [Chthonomonadales bacterium]
MQPEIAHREALDVIGMELPLATERPYLIMYAWIALAPRLGEVRGQVRPATLYGVWNHHDDSPPSSYVVGVEVRPGTPAPPGLLSVHVPAGRYAVLRHRGNIGRIGETFRALEEWFEQTGTPHVAAPVLEEYDTRQPLSDGYAFPIWMPTG